MVIHLRGQVLSLRTTLLHYKHYIVAVTKKDSNKLLEILFCIIFINYAMSKRGICSSECQMRT